VADGPDQRAVSGGTTMKRIMMRAVTALAIALTAAPAGAETLQEYARMRCRDFLSLPLETQVSVLFWIDGYLSRDTDRMTLPFIDVAYAIRGLEDSCVQQPSTTLGSYLGIRI
jgi:hypothetical protein